MPHITTSLVICGLKYQLLIHYRSFYQWTINITPPRPILHCGKRFSKWLFNLGDFNLHIPSDYMSQKSEQYSMLIYTLGSILHTPAASSYCPRVYTRWSDLCISWPLPTSPPPIFVNASTAISVEKLRNCWHYSQRSSIHEQDFQNDRLTCLFLVNPSITHESNIVPESDIWL